jgi:hypothetical protein
MPLIGGITENVNPAIADILSGNISVDYSVPVRPVVQQALVAAIPKPPMQFAPLPAMGSIPELKRLGATAQMPDVMQDNLPTSQIDPAGYSQIPQLPDMQQGAAPMVMQPGFGISPQNQRQMIRDYGTQFRDDLSQFNPNLDVARNRSNEVYTIAQPRAAMTDQDIIDMVGPMPYLRGSAPASNLKQSIGNGIHRFFQGAIPRAAQIDLNLYKAQLEVRQKMIDKMLSQRQQALNTLSANTNTAYAQENITANNILNRAVAMVQHAMQSQNPKYILDAIAMVTKDTPSPGEARNANIAMLAQTMDSIYGYGAGRMVWQYKDYQNVSAESLQSGREERNKRLKMQNDILAETAQDKVKLSHLKVQYQQASNESAALRLQLNKTYGDAKAQAEILSKIRSADKNAYDVAQDGFKQSDKIVRNYENYLKNMANPYLDDALRMQMQNEMTREFGAINPQTGAPQVVDSARMQRDKYKKSMDSLGAVIQNNVELSAGTALSLIPKADKPGQLLTDTRTIALIKKVAGFVPGQQPTLEQIKKAEQLAVDNGWSLPKDKK